MRHAFTLSFAALLIAAPAFGGVLHSAPAAAWLTETMLECTIRNVSSVEREVLFETLDSSGTVIRSDTEIVPAGEVRSLFDNSPIVLSTSCRFTVTGGSKNYRAQAVYFDPSDGIEMVIPAE